MMMWSCGLNEAAEAIYLFVGVMSRGRKAGDEPARGERIEKRIGPSLDQLMEPEHTMRSFVHGCGLVNGYLSPDPKPFLPFS